MPQSAILFTPFQSADGHRVIGRANDQGLLMANPSPGNSLFVNATIGSDSQANAGGPHSPFATLDAALDAAAANNNDYVYFWGTQARTSTLTWSKNGVNLVSLNAPSQNNRGRITGGGSTVFTPLVNVTAQGCRFIDIGTFYGYDDASAQICWQETGGRNYYDNCQFNGGGNATAAAQAGCRSMIIGGNGENIFNRCTWGLDTVARATAANATLEFVNSGGQGQRNVFYDPIFRMLSSLATNLHIKALAGATDRAQFMFNPMFFNAIDSTATALTVDISWAASASLLLSNPVSVGGTKIATGQAVYVTGPASNAGSGLATAAG